MLCKFFEDAKPKDTEAELSVSKSQSQSVLTDAKDIDPDHSVSKSSSKVRDARRKSKRATETEVSISKSSSILKSSSDHDSSLATKIEKQVPSAIKAKAMKLSEKDTDPSKAVSPRSQQKLPISATVKETRRENPVPKLSEAAKTALGDAPNVKDLVSELRKQSEFLPFAKGTPPARSLIQKREREEKELGKTVTH